jgi:hypothetical protein
MLVRIRLLIFIRAETGWSGQLALLSGSNHANSSQKIQENKKAPYRCKLEKRIQKIWIRRSTYDTSLTREDLIKKYRQVFRLDYVKGLSFPEYFPVEPLILKSHTAAGPHRLILFPSSCHNAFVATYMICSFIRF